MWDAYEETVMSLSTVCDKIENLVRSVLYLSGTANLK
jgi:hypothetical protein